MTDHATHAALHITTCPSCDTEYRLMADPGITDAEPDPEPLEQKAGRLLVEAARIRAARLGPTDAHELRHLWAAVNAGNSDPCGRNGEACHLDAPRMSEGTITRVVFKPTVIVPDIDVK